MRVEEAGKYLRLYREDGEHIVASRFLGWRQEKAKLYVTVENNVVNNILLGRDVAPKEYAPLHADEGYLKSTRFAMCKRWLRWAIFSIVTQWV